MATLLTGTQIKTALQQWRDSNLSDVTDATFLSWLNYFNRRAYRLASKLNPEKYATETVIKEVANTYSYSLPSAFWTIDAIWCWLFKVNSAIRISDTQYVWQQAWSSKEGFFINWTTSLIKTPTPTVTWTYLAFDTQTSNFTVWETLTWWTSNATWTIRTMRDDWTTWILELNNISWTFQDNEPLNTWIDNLSYASKSVSVWSQETFPTWLFIWDSWTKAYIIWNNNYTVFQYTLSTAYDISTASYASIYKDISSHIASWTPTALSFKSDWLTMYNADSLNQAVYQYTLSVAWDVSTASYASKTLDTSLQWTPTWMYLKSDWTKLFINWNWTIYQYTLWTAYDLSTAVYASKSMVSLWDAWIYFHSDGTKMYSVWQLLWKIYEYSLSTAWDISTWAYTWNSGSILTEDALQTWLFIRDDFSTFYTLWDTNNKIFQYTLAMAYADGTLMTPRILKYLPISTKLTALWDSTIIDEQFEENALFALNALYDAWLVKPSQAMEDERFIRALDEFLDNYREEAQVFKSFDNSYAY